MVRPLDYLLDLVFLARLVPSFDKVHLGVVIDYLAKTVWHDCLARLLDNSLYFRPGQLRKIFHDILFDSAALCSEYSHQGLSELVVHVQDGCLRVDKEQPRHLVSFLDRLTQRLQLAEVTRDETKIRPEELVDKTVHKGVHIVWLLDGLLSHKVG